MIHILFLIIKIRSLVSASYSVDDQTIKIIIMITIIKINRIGIKNGQLKNV